MSETLIIFTRFPVPGKTKTRLIPGLGEEGASALQELMTGRLLIQAKLWAVGGNRTIHVLTTGGTQREFQRWLGKDLTYLPQAEGDLGQRMEQAIRHAFEAGAKKVTVVGADCPALMAETFEQAFGELDDHDVVLNPAEDGGYVLLGMNQFHSAPFHQVDWGTETVLDQTRAHLRSAGLRVEELPAQPDIDVPEDLPVWDLYWKQAEAGSLSVVIPALNEGARVAAAIASALPETAEVIVADGGSRDETVQIAEQAGAKVVRCGRGRGTQQNAGAAVATGEFILFLHADAILPEGYGREVRRLLAAEPEALGAFRLALRGERLGFRLVEWGVLLRSRFQRLPFGDQAFFLRRDRFAMLGGFPADPLLEDVALVQKARVCGPVVTSHAAVTVSPRRWQRLGIVRTTLVNQLILSAYAFGVSPKRLAAWYR